MNKETYLPAFVLRSSYRKEIFRELSQNQGITQKDLLLLTSPKYRSHVSRTIKELSDKGLIVCKNPDDRTYKMYDLTPKGLEVKEEISKLYSSSKK